MEFSDVSIFPEIKKCLQDLRQMLFTTLNISVVKVHCYGEH